MIIAEIKENLLDTKIPNIAHGVNCQNVMGSGVAKAIYTNCPVVKKEYHKFVTSLENLSHTGFKSSDLLGKVQKIRTENSKTIFNCFTQEFYGCDGRIYVNYHAIERCLDWLICYYKVKELAIPKIGCGLAGGDWETVKKIINGTTGDSMDVTVYYL